MLIFKMKNQFLKIILILAILCFIISKEKGNLKLEVVNTDELSSNNIYLEEIENKETIDEETNKLIKMLKAQNLQDGNSYREQLTDIVGDKNECLEDEKVIKSKYLDVIKQHNLDVDSTIKRLRFIHGKCSPVLFYPGLLATQINLVINCKRVKEDKNLWDEINFYCHLSSLCKNNNVETHTIWPNLNKSVFYMLIDKNNLYNQCFGYFASYYNSPDVCKADDGSNHCRFSKFISIVPKGIEKTTNDKDFKRRVDDFECGSRSINNIMATTTAEYLVNQLIGTTKGFLDLKGMLDKTGHIEAFSYASLAYDFREAQCNNKNANVIFRKFITSMYNLTGKKVVIVAHSYGNVNTHFQLTEENKDLKEMIGHFVSIAPPFFGSLKTDYLLGRGGTEFKKSIIGFDIVDLKRFAQIIGLNYVPTIFTMRKFDYLQSLDKYYKDNEKVMNLKKVLENYLTYSTCEQYHGSKAEKNCNVQAKKDLINMFPEELGFMNDTVFCKAEDDNKGIHNDKFNINKYNDNDTSNIPINSLCNFKLIDNVKCASVKYSLDSNPRYTTAFKQKEILNDLCVFEKVIRKSGKLYYLDNKQKTRNDVTDYLKENGLKQKHFKDEMIHLCNSRYLIPDEDCSNKIETIYKAYDAPIETRRKEVLANICNDTKAKLDHPDVPVTLIYNRSVETRTGFLAENVKYNRDQVRQESFFSNGDGTVEADSSLFVGLKWLLDYKYNNKPTVKIFDFCAPLRKTNEATSKYLYKGKEDLTSNKNYFFLDCDCYDPKTNYYGDNLGKCTHAELLVDTKLIGLVRDIITTQKHPAPEQDIQKLVLRVGTNNQKDQSEKCMALYDELFYKNFDFN